MDCREFQKFVHVYLDGELDARDRGEIEGHLRQCDGCRSQARFEHWFRDGVRKSFVPEGTPSELVSRIRSQLAKAPAPRSPTRMVLGPIAAVLVLGVLIGYIWSLMPFGNEGALGSESRVPGALAALGELPSATPAPVAPLAAASAPARRAPVPSPVQLAAARAEASAPVRADESASSAVVQARLAAEVRAAGAAIVARVAADNTRRARRAPPVDEGAASSDVVEASAEAPATASRAVVVGERDLPMQFMSSDPTRVRAFLEQRLQTPIVLPRFRGRARVVGGGAGESDATAQVVYRYRGDNLYLQIRPYPDPTLPAQGIVVRQENGHRVAAWQRGGLTYSMTSRLDPVEMVRLVASEISERHRPELPQRMLGAGEPRPSNYSEATPVSFSAP